MQRALALLAPALLVVGLVACGDDDDDSPDTTTATEATTDVTTAEVTTPATDAEDTDAGGSIDEDQTDTMRQIFPNLDGDQIDCLVEQVDDFTDAIDQAQAQAIAAECDIDPADLVPDMSAVSIPDLGDVSIPENMDELIKQVFPSLTDEQAECLAEQFGSDFDPAKAAQVADTCNIDPTDLIPGG
jgi:hypothetical protein